MLPAEVYIPRSYPPVGRHWPGWGDRQLDTAFANLSEEAHANLLQKREDMRQVHETRLEKQGLAPYKTSYPQPPPPPPPSPDVPHYNMDAPEAKRTTAEQDTQTEQKQLVYQRGVVTEMAPERKQLVYQRDVAAQMAPERKQLVYQRGAAASALPVTTTDAHTQASLATEMDDAASVSDYGTLDIDVDDTQMDPRADKRKHPEPESKEQKKPKVKSEVKAEVKATVKQEGGKPVKKDTKTSKKKKDDDDEPQMTGVNINRSKDMAFWEEQSARELRTQLNIREPGKVGDWAFKTRLQLLNIVRDMIIRGSW